MSSLLEEAHTRVVYRQSAKETRHVARDLGLPAPAVAHIPQLGRGCAVWVVGRHVRIVQHVMTDWEYRIVATDAAMTDHPQPVGPLG